MHGEVKLGGILAGPFVWAVDGSQMKLVRDTEDLRRAAEACAAKKANKKKKTTLKVADLKPSILLSQNKISLDIQHTVSFVRTEPFISIFAGHQQKLVLILILKAVLPHLQQAFQQILKQVVLVCL